jgi:hypothetical protein
MVIPGATIGDHLSEALLRRSSNTNSLPDEINQTAAPQDVVSAGALRQRVLNEEGAIGRNPTNSEPDGCSTGCGERNTINPQG